MRIIFTQSSRIHIVVLHNGSLFSFAHQNTQGDSSLVAYIRDMHNCINLITLCYAKYA